MWNDHRHTANLLFFFLILWLDALLLSSVEPAASFLEAFVLLLLLPAFNAAPEFASCIAPLVFLDSFLAADKFSLLLDSLWWVILNSWLTFELWEFGLECPCWEVWLFMSIFLAPSCSLKMAMSFCLLVILEAPKWIEIQILTVLLKTRVTKELSSI